jgi:bacteriorhodopsin
MKNIEYILFGQHITHRTYTWLWFLCPGVALMIMLAARRVGAADQTPASSPSVPTR